MMLVRTGDFAAEAGLTASNKDNVVSTATATGHTRERLMIAILGTVGPALDWHNQLHRRDGRARGNASGRRRGQPWSACTRCRSRGEPELRLTPAVPGRSGR